MEVDNMQQNRAWLKFLITGNPKDYLNFKNKANEQEIYRGEDTANYDRWPCDKGNDYKG